MTIKVRNDFDYSVIYPTTNGRKEVALFYSSIFIFIFHFTFSGSAVTMDPLETAQAIFPSMARPLQKYLRVTRQQNRHTLQSILDHLSVAMKYGLSAKAFLEKYISPGPVLIDEQERKPVQSWGLVSDLLLSRSIRDGAVFMLRQGDISLLVTVSSLPFFDLQEEVIDPKSNRFVLRLNSETSV